MIEVNPKARKLMSDGVYAVLTVSTVTSSERWIIATLTNQKWDISLSHRKIVAKILIS